MLEFISPVLRVMIVITGILCIMTIPVFFGLIKVIIGDIQDYKEKRRSSGKEENEI